MNAKYQITLNPNHKRKKERKREERNRNANGKLNGNFEMAHHLFPFQ